MKEISIEGLKVIELLPVNLSVYICGDSNNYMIKVMDEKIKKPHYTEHHTLVLKRDLSNLETINKILNLFDIKIVKPLIDFTKPLSEELKRLADEDEWKADWSDDNQAKFFVFFTTKRTLGYDATYLEHVGTVYMSQELCIKVTEYFNENKEQAIKAMEL